MLQYVCFSFNESSLPISLLRLTELLNIPAYTGRPWSLLLHVVPLSECVPLILPSCSFLFASRVKFQILCWTRHSLVCKSLSWVGTGPFVCIKVPSGRSFNSGICILFLPVSRLAQWPILKVLLLLGHRCSYTIWADHKNRLRCSYYPLIIE